MLDLGVIAIWGDSHLELRDEFMSSLNDEFGIGLSGTHTVYLCLYEKGFIHVDPIVVSVYADAPMFFFTDARLTLELDSDMNAVKGAVEPNADSFLRMLYSDMIDVYHVGPICTDKGFAWEAFTLLDESSVQNATIRYESDIVDDTMLTIDEDDLMDVAFEFLDWRREKFLMDIEQAVATESDIDPSDNPYEDSYYAAKYGGIRTSGLMVSNTDTNE